MAGRGRRPVGSRPGRRETLFGDSPKEDREVRLCIIGCYREVIDRLDSKEFNLAEWLEDCVDTDIFGEQLAAIVADYKRQQLGNNPRRARWIVRRLLGDIGLEKSATVLNHDGHGWNRDVLATWKRKISDRRLYDLIEEGDPERLKGSAAERARAAATKKNRSLHAAWLRAIKRELADAERGVEMANFQKAATAAALDAATAKQKQTADYAATVERTASVSVAKKAARRAAQAAEDGGARKAEDAAAGAALVRAQESAALVRQKLTERE